MLFSYNEYHFLYVYPMFIINGFFTMMGKKDSQLTSLYML